MAAFRKDFQTFLSLEQIIRTFLNDIYLRIQIKPFETFLLWQLSLLNKIIKCAKNRKISRSLIVA